ncbi:MAG: MFS transporter [Thermoplasmatales archaeon B_DKE]|nr:MAG: MFS transporter [Thermoplasmatales archaeon B_DKE]
MSSNRKIIALRSFVISAGATAAASFVGVYGVMIGATAAEMGWLQSSSNALTNGGQLLWGKLSDKYGKRLPFLILGSIVLAVLWALMGMVRSPIQLIVVYAVLSLMSAMITVNWFSLIAEIEDSATRGHFLSVINNFSSMGAIISLVLLSFLLHTATGDLIIIPFGIAAGSYVVSAIMLSGIREKKREKVSIVSRTTLKQIREHKTFFSYFLAMNVQGFFWSMAWPVFPITIVLVMHFDLSTVAILTAASLSATVMMQLIVGRYVDKISRPPLIFTNRILLSMIPLLYAVFSTFYEFVILELYSGIVGAIQNVVMNSYVLDIVPDDHRGEYISILNGFNGIMYFLGALAGGYLLQFFMGRYALREALTFTYSFIIAGRFASSFLFLRLKESDIKRGNRGFVYSLLLRFRTPGAPSGGVVKPR